MLPIAVRMLIGTRNICLCFVIFPAIQTPSRKRAIRTPILSGEFLRLPANPNLEVTFLEQDNMLVILPEGHYLADKEKISVADLCREPFLMLKRGDISEIPDIFSRSELKPDVCFTTWDDYAIMSMVEKGLGISILPQLILKRIPYRIVTKELDKPIYRKIGIGVRNKKSMSLAAEMFMDYLIYR